MNPFCLLAEASEGANFTASDIEIVPIDFVWEQIASLSWLQAVIGISFGVVYLLYGWRIFKVLVTICFGLVGLFIGMNIGAYFSTEIGAQIWGGVTGLAVLAFVSVPLMKICVSILGALAGGIITGGLWYAFGLSEMYIWAGVIVGIVAGGMISFIALRVAVMLFTSLGGGMITMVGILALLHLYENAREPVTTRVHDMVFDNNWFLPVALIIPTVIGIITQNKFIKSSHKWEL